MRELLSNQIVTVRARTGLNYLSKLKLIYVTALPIRLNLRRDYVTSQRWQLTS